MKNEKEIKLEIERLKKNLSIWESSIEDLNIKINNINRESYNGFENTIRKQHEIEAINSVKSTIFMNIYIN